ncbi:hypothetical protein Taro_040987 [Colocasia esculenta]|uniref:Uncharacterized protein n=1 Tax=Colocasia esculenta TaxID=4460 RepID=A0A843WD74_COLES|nr:hypothetical protein [Colocasia esculenta]
MYSWQPKFMLNYGTSFRTCWGRVEELLVAEELWNDHKKLIFFPRSSAATCTNRPLEVGQRESLVRNPKHYP